jgi:hypothetical protein
MPTRTSPDPPRYDATVQRNPKNVFGREPLVVPRLFDDAPPPWYQRRSAIALGSVGFLCLAGFAVAVQQYGLAGTAEWAGRIGTNVLRAFARAVS